jgi:hypothetical protein
MADPPNGRSGEKSFWKIVASANSVGKDNIHSGDEVLSIFGIGLDFGQ